MNVFEKYDCVITAAHCIVNRYYTLCGYLHNYIQMYICLIHIHIFTTQVCRLVQYIQINLDVHKQVWLYKGTGASDISMGYCKKDVTPICLQWSCNSSALAMEL